MDGAAHPLQEYYVGPVITVSCFRLSFLFAAVELWWVLWFSVFSKFTGVELLLVLQFSKKASIYATIILRWQAI